MEKVNLNQLINNCQTLSSILSKLYILEEEFKYFTDTKKYELLKNVRLNLKKEYNKIRELQLNTISIPIDSNDFSSKFYRSYILSFTERKNELNNLNSILFCVICNTIYSNLLPNNVNNKKFSVKVDKIPFSDFSLIFEVLDEKINEMDSNKTINQPIIKDFNGEYVSFQLNSNTDIAISDINKIIELLKEKFISNKILIFSKNQNNDLSFVIIACFLIKLKIVKKEDITGLINYFCSLNLWNTKEFFFTEKKLQIIDEFSKIL
jgi:hypothetical protein